MRTFKQSPTQIANAKKNSAIQNRNRRKEPVIVDWDVLIARWKTMLDEMYEEES